MDTFSTIRHTFVAFLQHMVVFSQCAVVVALVKESPLISNFHLISKFVEIRLCYRWNLCAEQFVMIHQTLVLLLELFCHQFFHLKLQNEKNIFQLNKLYLRIKFFQ